MTVKQGATLTFIAIIDALCDFNVVQSILTIITVTAIISLYVVGRTVPNELFAILSAIIGYYFGRQGATDVKNALNDVKNHITSEVNNANS